MKKISFLFFIFLSPAMLFAQDENLGLNDHLNKGVEFPIRQPDKASTSITFSCGGTNNDTSAVYYSKKYMSVQVNVSSSGTVTFNALFQMAVGTSSGGLPSDSDFHTVKTTAISATGMNDIIITESSIPNYRFWRIVFDGQTGNDASTQVDSAKFSGVD